MTNIPNQWTPRAYQRNLYNNFGYGFQHQRASWIVHRRAGKDSTALNLTARDMFRRIGTYWHLFPEQTQARRAIWNGIDRQGRRIIDQFLPPDVRQRASGNEMLIEATNGSVWQMAGSDNYDSLVGSNPVGVVFSEWALANPAAWDYIRPILLENDGWALFITTPRGRNHAYQTHMRALKSDRWFAETLTVNDTGVLTEAHIQQERDDGMSEAKIQQEYYCSFEAETDEQFMPTAPVMAAMREEVGVNPTDPLVLGVDVARFGDDKSVLRFRRGRDARTIPPQKFEKIDTMQLAARVAEAIQRENPDAVFVDEGGLGAGVVDRLHQLNFHQVQGVNFGSSSDYRVDGAPKCVNKRTEMWATMRELIKAGMMIDSDPVLSYELLAPTFSYDKNNLIQLEKKEDMRKRGLKSPDDADALALTFAYPVQPYSMQQRHEQQQEPYDPFRRAS